MYLLLILSLTLPANHVDCGDEVGLADDVWQAKQDGHEFNDIAFVLIRTGDWKRKAYRDLVKQVYEYDETRKETLTGIFRECKYD